MKCRHCEKEIKDTAKFCPYCGGAVKIQENKKSGKNHLFLVIIAVFVLAAAVILFCFVKDKQSRKTEDIPAALTDLREQKNFNVSPGNEASMELETAPSFPKEAEPPADDSFAETATADGSYESAGLTVESEEVPPEAAMDEIMEEETAAQPLPADFDCDAEREKVVLLYREIEDHLQEYLQEEFGTTIRYTSADGIYQKSVTKVTDTGEIREYFYENGILRFAFYHNRGVEKRFYFLDETMFRYIDPQHTIHDLEFQWDEYISLGKSVLRDSTVCK